MKDKILQLCKRLNKFSLENLEILSEIPKSNLLSLLDEFVNEGKLITRNNEYIYCKQNPVIQNHSIFKLYPAVVTDTVIRCFCEDIKTIKTSNIANIGEDQVQKFYTIFRTLIYQRQKRQLDSYYLKQPQKARHRKFFNKEVYLYFYFNQIFVSETLLKSKNDRMFSSKEKAEFTTIYCYLSRNLTHNTNANNLNYKIAETLWRRKRGFKDLYFDLKSLVQH